MNHQHKFDRLVEQLQRLRRGTSASGQRDKPHKLIMVLAVVELFEEGHYTENRIPYDETLKSWFQRLFAFYSESEDWCQPAPPFFHLRSSGFWHHAIKAGREAEYAKLTTSGGGDKRIHLNISHAYLSDDAFDVINDPLARQHIRRTIIEILAYGGANAMAEKRVAMVFHESFALNVPSLATILRLSDMTNGQLTSEMIRAQSNLGTNYVKAMPRYATACGLLDFSPGRKLTPLGKVIHSHDPFLSQQDTLWLLHYHLCAPEGPGPLLWHQLAKTRLVPGQHLTQADIQAEAQEQLKGDTIATESITRFATVFRKTYERSDALGPLGILTETSDGFVVQEPDPPSTWVVGYALAHYWQQKWPHLGQINLEELYEPGGFASLLFLSNYALNRSLRELQRHQRLELWQVAPPYQLVKLWHSPNDFLPHLYS